MNFKSLRSWLARLGGLFQKERRDRELAEELEMHLQLYIDDKVQSGMTPEEARRDALIKFGSVEATKERYRERRGVPALENLIRDLRYAVRVQRRSPGFTAMAVLTLALGVGANTAIFSVVNAVLLRPLNYREPERLVMVWEELPAVGVRRDTPAPGNFNDWKTQNRVFEDMAALEYRNYDLTGDGGEPERLFAYGVSTNFFSLLGVGPAEGRDFTPEEGRPGADKVAVISHGLWQRRFGGERAVVGRDVLLNGEKHTIVGVMPRGFQFGTLDMSVWTPFTLTPEQLSNRSIHFLEVVARLKPGVTAAQADADLKAITGRIAAAYPDDAEGLSAEVVPLHEQVAGGVRRPLTMLLVAVAFVLLIACANVGGVLLSRSAARSREIAVRAALGASRWRIVRQLLTESVLLGVAGGLLGSILAVWAFAFLQQLVPAGMRESAVLQLDMRVLGFTLLISLLAGVVFGLAPALHASRADLNDALKQGGRAGVSKGQRRLRNSFVVAEVALSLVLLVGAGLLIQTLQRLRGQYSNLQLESVLTLQTQLAGNRYKESARRAAFYDEVLARVKSLPGVVAVGYTTGVPLVRKGGANGLSLEGRDNGPGAFWNANHRQISPDYFRAMGVEVRQGRAFDERDDEGATPVVAINETMARAYWPGESALGKRFKAGAPESPEPWLTVVGVVADVRQTGVDTPIKAEMYVPYRQAAKHWQTPPYSLFPPRDLVIRTSVAPTSLVASVRDAVHDVDPYQPLSSVRTMDEVLGRETAQRRVGMILLTAFAGLALLLSALGIYGVLAYFVVQHTPEIGVRMALGAQRRDVLRLVLGKGMRLALTGVCVGLAGAYALTRLLQSLLFEVKATDPLTFGLIALLLTTVALIACYIPARRATRVDPMVALRYE
ncbi:MAG TPA: ABC transporter permease [Pyrinomonadaceae bacterium]|nr:ABC transporter permease [Pyrinomonadaceae bacterium]